MSALSLRLTGVLLFSGLAAVAPTACQQLPFNQRMPYPSQPPGPVVESLVASPTQVALDKAMSFTISAKDRDNKKLSYGWAATGGTLVSASGTKVSWKPTKADGSPEAPGVYAVTVTATNGKETETATIALRITATGASVFQPTAVPPDVVATPAPVSDPSPGASASPDGAASAQTGCAVGAVVPSIAQPGTVFTVSGSGFSDDVSVKLGDTTVQVLAATSTRLTVAIPSDVGIDGVALPVTVTSCGQTKKATGTLTMADTSDFDGDVKSAGGGLLATVTALDTDTAGLPEDLDKQTPLATFLASKIDVPSGFLRGAIPTKDGDRTEWFAIRYTGQLQVPTTGVTAFNLASESGARLFIDGKAVVEDDGTSNQGTDGEAELSAGKHSFRLEYRHGAGRQTTLQLYWSPPGAAESIVPATAFSLPAAL